MTWEALGAEAEGLESALAQARECQAMEDFVVQIARHQARDDE